MKHLTIGFYGLGLIGGSIARALKQSNLPYTLIVYEKLQGPSESDIEQAQKEGIIHQRFTEFIACYSQCDFIFLCAPIISNMEVLSKLKGIIKKTCIITDVSSVKGSIHQTIDTLGLSANFVGGHPMAGSEKTGFCNSRSNLLENAFYILTRTDKCSEVAITDLIALLKPTGAIPVLLSVKEHDEITATISHLPHIIAAELVNLVRNSNSSEEMKQLAAGGFRDITRIASSSPVMWQNICLTNTTPILNALNRYIDSLNDVVDALKNKDSNYLYQIFDEAGTYRNALPKRLSGSLSELYEIYLDIVDEAGAIATIATILATNQLSLKNIGIIHNREFQDGVLRIEFYDHNTMRKSIEILKRYHYTVYER